LESLDNKLDRLSSDQRREVEDFVDFLLTRAAVVPATPPVPAAVPPVMSAAPPVLSARDLSPVHAPEDTIAPVETDDPASLHEIIAGGDDWVTHDYMDYGKFEQQPSPATEAVKKVKQKIITRQVEERSKDILDWVD
jgi:hypothetical protein